MYKLHYTECRIYLYTVKPVLRDHLWDKEKSDFIRQVTSQKRLISHEIVYDRARKRWRFNTGGCLIEVTARTGLTICENMLQSQHFANDNP